MSTILTNDGAVYIDGARIAPPVAVEVITDQCDRTFAEDQDDILREKFDTQDWNPGEPVAPGRWLFAFRRHHGVSRKTLARMANVSPATIARWENYGERSDDAWRRARALARAIWNRREK